VDAGVDFLITQLFFDNRHYWNFCEKARAAGINIPIIPGIMPLANVAQVERFGATLPAQLAAELDLRRGDAMAVTQLGVAHATAQCLDLLRGGAPGIHFYTLNRSTAAKDVFGELRVAGLA
jgi:methylenetetrahydrofolate reductase (NADPH)